MRRWRKREREVSVVQKVVIDCFGFFFLVQVGEFEQVPSFMHLHVGFDAKVGD